MEIGKVPGDLLQKLILNRIPVKRKEVLLAPKIGEDCCAIDFGEYACVLSTDPITGAVNEVGRLAVHISCNDVASCGVEPLGLLITILAPPETTETDLGVIMQQICETAEALQVDIVGGHTEITGAVNRIVISSTALGRAVKGKLVSTSGARPGDSVIMTKWAGIEGTAIIAHDRKAEVGRTLGPLVLEKARNFMNQISVVKEGVAAGQAGATAMHDATEGGILGAVWEVCEASNTGIRLYSDRIPVAPETKAICSLYGIDPLRLISSGCMIIACPDGEEMVRSLKKAGVQAAVIGEMTEGPERLMIGPGGMIPITPPEADELYKVV